ncbi:28S ribosomal protein S18c, mitochondrial-like isoform X2 [Limulus polyphemus]|uniref:28S ribosomal protein S18c, mitochondrial-like isoform X2 n=1 Tax=Limulus polyphemus TaxID=6850 RepID=A0ABM1BZS4_LIMPO|nr:28S ribosomal protein S18c, mitochondrial-like isoform X2 [Limulus polyphemus]
MFYNSLRPITYIFRECRFINRRTLIGMKFSSVAESERDYEAVGEKISSSDDMPVRDMKNPYEKEKIKCILCKYGIHVDYKNIRLLSQFVSPYTGRIYDKHITGLCDAQQKKVKQEILKAQNFGFMPTITKEVKFFKDPKLFDPFNPKRPHPH